MQPTVGADNIFWLECSGERKASESFSGTMDAVAVKEGKFKVVEQPVGDIPDGQGATE